MQAIHQEILPPSGVEFATCMKLTPSTVTQNGPSGSQTSKRVLFNIVVARSNVLRVFEVCEEPAPISQQKEDERERRASVRKGTEAVEGEVAMDGSGEGFVNMGTVKVNLRPRALRCHISSCTPAITFYSHSFAVSLRDYKDSC
jgi:cleavage and polyadenylation specificity factor subunit 1